MQFTIPIRKNGILKYNHTRNYSINKMNLYLNGGIEIDLNKNDT